MKRRGFSLIEVMVSGTLLVVGLAASFSAYQTIGTHLNHTVHLSTAGSLAEATLEELVLRYPADPALSLGEHVDTPRHYDKNGARVASADVYAVTWNVIPYAKLTTMREVIVKVAWTDVSGARTLEVRTWRN